MNKHPPSHSVDVDIVGLTKKGNGLGITSDESKRKVEVPFTIPGDKARVVIHRKRSGVHSCHLQDIVTPSPSRIEPRCIHFAACGGCRWQHMSYENQLEIKQNTIKDLFQPLINPATQINPIIPCDPPWQYRNKMEFSFSSDAAGKQFAGLFIDNSRGKVLNLTECHLVNPWFVETLTAARQWWIESGLTAYHPYSNRGSLRTLILREGMRTGDRLVMLTVSGNPDFALSKQQLESFCAYMRDAAEPLSPGSHLSIFLRIQQIAKGTPTSFYEMLLHGPDHLREILYIQPDPIREPIKLTFSVSPSAFFQPNTKQAEKLYSKALQLLEIKENSVVYDLYCGTGTLGICAARDAKEVIGIEISPESSLDARTNATSNGFKNVKIITGAVDEVMAKMRHDPAFPHPDVVMVDPPRMGLDSETLHYLIELRPDKILYISCNPATQAENIKVLKEAGYEIKAVQPVDQFPQTVHIENIVILVAAS